MTKLDTTVAFLEKNALWDDMERANDISYYEVAAPASARRASAPPRLRHPPTHPVQLTRPAPAHPTLIRRTPARPTPAHEEGQGPNSNPNPNRNQVGQGTFEGKYATQGKG